MLGARFPALKQPMPRDRRALPAALLTWLALVWTVPGVRAAPPQGRALPRVLTEQAAVDWAMRHNERVLDAHSRVKERRGERIESRRWLPSSPRVGVGADMREAVDRGNLEASLSLRQEF